MRGNNVLNVLLKKAVEWEVIGRMPCAIRLLPIPKASATFHDFDDSERLVSAAGTTEPLAILLWLLGGDAGPVVRRDDGLGVLSTF